MKLMEDLDFVLRLKRKYGHNRGRLLNGSNNDHNERGPLYILPSYAYTSARRWLKLGVLKTTMINNFIVAAYCCGVSTDTLARWYYTTIPRFLIKKQT